MFRAPNVGAGLAYIAEPIATVGSSLAGEVAGGLGALATLDPSKVEAIHHALTYQPQTGAGRAGLADLGELLSGAGGLAMDAPYLGAAIRNFGESRDALIESGHPGLAAALQTAPAFVATMVAPEARLAARNVGGEIGSTIASGGNIGRGGMPASQRGMITFHGSPHKFQNFDINKMGTGEGELSHGKGLYFSDSKKIAEQYKKGDRAYSLGDDGYLYDVDIPDSHIKSMMDLDKPISDQPKNIQKSLSGIMDELYKYNPELKGKNLTGRDIQKEYSWMKELDDDQVNKGFKSAGITGFKYAETSPTAAEKGATNFIVFDDKIPKIKAVNGQPIVKTERPFSSQSGFINPQAMAMPLGKAFKFSRAAKAATGTLAGERTAQTVGKALEGAHKATVAEKTASSHSDDKKGRNLLAPH